MVWLQNLPDHWWQEHSAISLDSRSIEELNIELLFLVRTFLLDTRAYARVCKRARLMASDFQVTLDTRHIHLALHSTAQDVISLSSLIDQKSQIGTQAEMIRLTMHWLAIDGEQPIIAENPVPNFREETKSPRMPGNNRKALIPAALLSDQSALIQNLFHLAGTVEENTVELSHHVHPLTMNNLTMKPTYPRQVSFRRPPTNNTAPSSTPPSLPCLAHELSVEQQLYFQMLTETCFNGSEQQRTSAFRSFSSDAALQPLLPRLTLFITQGIQVNLHLRDLRFIIRFLSILKMLTINSHLSFEKHLHLVITSLFTCLLCIFDLPKASSLVCTPEKQPANSYPTVWIVREQASDLLICFQQKYSHIPNLTGRITSILRSTLITNSKAQTYSIVYGCLRTLIAIPCSSSGPMAKDLIQECLTNKVLEADFDLDPIQQYSLFKEKLYELIRKYQSVDSQSDGDKMLLSQ